MAGDPTTLSRAREVRLALNTRRDTFDNMRMSYFRRARPLLLGLILVVAVTAGVGALAARNPVFGYTIDLPIGWTDSDSSDP